jgi:hypothetical protein
MQIEKKKKERKNRSRALTSHSRATPHTSASKVMSTVSMNSALPSVSSGKTGRMYARLMKNVT